MITDQYGNSVHIVFTIRISALTADLDGDTEKYTWNGNTITLRVYAAYATDNVTFTWERFDAAQDQWVPAEGANRLSCVTDPVTERTEYRFTLADAGNPDDFLQVSCFVNPLPDADITLPPNLEMIDEDAFMGLPAGTVFFMPHPIDEIAETAFDSTAIIIAPVGSPMLEWAENQGLTAYPLTAR